MDSTLITYCGRCHTCGAMLTPCLDGEEWCPVCGIYRRYRTHGWVRDVWSDDTFCYPPAARRATASSSASALTS